MKQNINIVIPLAGEGKRFVDAGYKEPKPFIDFGYHLKLLIIVRFSASVVFINFISKP